MPKDILSDYLRKFPEDQQSNAAKQFLQGVVLSGLARTGFFQNSAFCGGTALRLFYNLPRFSEDLDFSRLLDSPEFSWKSYFPAVEQELRFIGLTDFSLSEKKKKKPTPVKTAYLKIKEHSFLPYSDMADPRQLMRIKLEMDTALDRNIQSEWEELSFPEACKVRLLDEPTLFAGKLAAIATRNWDGREKGRDLYDMEFYLSQGTSFNLYYFTSQIRRNPEYADFEPRLREVQALLNQKFETMDYEKAKNDVLPFLEDRNAVNSWNAEHFQALTRRLRVHRYPADVPFDKDTVKTSLEKRTEQAVVQGDNIILPEQKEKPVGSGDSDK